MINVPTIIHVRLRRLQTKISHPFAAGWFFTVSLLLLIAPIAGFYAAYGHGGSDRYGVIGGPEVAAPILGTLDEAALQTAAGTDVVLEGAQEDAGVAGFYVVSNDSFLSAGAPIFNAMPRRDGVVSYVVQPGDNLSIIAARFGLSLNTIYWSNDLASAIIQPGDELIILPTNGVLHTVSGADTLASLAHTYEADEDAIVDVNDISGGVLIEGSTIIIPNGQRDGSLFSRRRSGSRLPDYADYFAMPTTGWNWGRLHNNNAVDIANKCGTEVYAAAGGVVLESEDSGWNYGYGNYVILEHPNGTKTRYAHLNENAVEVGDLVNRGDDIGSIGNTGKTHGPTGCHLHFEVHGAQNPFAK